MRVLHPSRSASISSLRISSLVTSRYLFRSYPSGPSAKPRHCGVICRAHYPFRTLWHLIFLLGIAWSDFRFSLLQKVLSSRTPFILSSSAYHSFAWTFFPSSLIFIRVILYTSRRITPDLYP